MELDMSIVSDDEKLSEDVVAITLVRKRGRGGDGLRSPLVIDHASPTSAPIASPLLSPFFRARSRGMSMPSLMPSPRRERGALHEWRELICQGKNPPPMSGLTASYFDSTMYIFGGYHNSDAMDGLYALDLLTGVWSAVATVGPAPSPRTSHSAAVDVERGKLYICCGSGSLFGHTNMGDFFELDLRLRYWRKLEFTGDEITPRYGQSAVFYDRKLFVFGGTFGREFSQEFFVLDLDTRRSTLVKGDGGAAPGARYKHAAGIFDHNKLLVFGGAERQNYKLNDVWYANLDTCKWTKLDCGGAQPGGRFAHSMCIHRDKAYVFGGTDREVCQSDLYILDIATRMWTQMNCTGKIPRGRYFHGSVFDDSTGEMLTWGGKGSNEAQVRFNDLYAIWLDRAASDRQATGECTLARDLAALFSSGDLTDVKVIARDGTTFAAHQFLLRARCAFLCDRIQFGIDMADEEDGEGSLMETCGDHDGALPACLRLDFIGDVVKQILTYLYSDNIALDMPASATLQLEVMFAAVSLGLPRLSSICEKRLRRGITVPVAIACIGTMANRSPRLDSLERFLLQFTHVHCAQAHGPGRPLSPDPTAIVAATVPVNPSPASPVARSPSPPHSSRNSSPSRFTLEALVVPPSTLHADIGALRRLSSAEAEQESVPFDIRFQCGRSRERIWAHQVILAARSSYFGSFSFMQGMREAITRVCTFPESGEGVLSKDAFCVLLDYIYGGEPAAHPRLTDDIIVELLSVDVCNYFGLSSHHFHGVLKRELARTQGALAEHERAQWAKKIPVCLLT